MAQSPFLQKLSLNPYFVLRSVPSLKLKDSISLVDFCWSISQRVRVSTLDVRSNPFDAQATGRSVAKHVDVVAKQANGANSGVIPISATALALDEN
jgi:hypothetical protein